MRGSVATWSSLLVSDMRFGRKSELMRKQLAYDIPRKVYYRFSQNAKKAFWINIYNAFYIHMTNKYEKPAKYFADKKDIVIGDFDLSLNEIERDILCGYRSTGLFKGYFRNLRGSDIVKKFAVNDYDPRVHFALCRSVVDGPEVIAYDRDIIDQQLNYTAGLFLETNIDFDHENKKVVLPRYFDEYYYAIGGKKAIVEVVYECMDAEIDDYDFSYKDFDKPEDVIRYADNYQLANFMR